MVFSFLSTYIDAVSEYNYTLGDTESEWSLKESMPKGSPTLTAARREEIINACEMLYQTMSFKDITLKEIGNVTSFTRTSIYNYFQTKEEIFLALYEREYNRWNEELQEMIAMEEKLSTKKLAERIATSIAHREQLLKLLSMNNYDMEANSRTDCLVSFKVAYGTSIDTMRKILKKHRVSMEPKDIEQFIYIFFPFMFGIYPYASVTFKQKEAMKEAHVNYTYHSIYELTYNCLMQLLEK